MAGAEKGAEEPAKDIVLKKAPRSRSGAGVFTLGLFLGAVISIAALVGLALYLLDTKSPHLQRFLDLHAQRLDAQLQEQAQQFDRQVNMHMERQSQRLQEAIEHAERVYTGDLGEQLAPFVDQLVVDSIDRQESHPAEMAERSYLRAMDLFSKGEFILAGIYLSNAANHDPANWEYLEAYIDQLLEWTGEQVNERELVQASGMLAEMRAFVVSQLVHLEPEDLDSADTMLKSIDGAITRIDEKLEAIQVAMLRAEFERSTVTLRELLEKEAPITVDAQRERMDELDRLIQQVDTLSIGDTEDTQDLMEKAREYRNQLGNGLVVSEMLDGAEYLVNEVVERGGKADEQLTKLAAASQALDRVRILVDDNSGEVLARVESLESFIEKMRLRLTELQREPLLKAVEALEDKYRQLSVKNAGHTLSYKQASQSIRNVLEDAVNMSHKSGEAEVSDRLTGLIANLSQELKEWEKVQLRRYSAWAVNQVQTFHKKHKEELKTLKNTNESRIYTGLKKELGPIDNRFLSFAASRAYNEVFDLYFNHLNSEHRISLTSEMALMKKVEFDQVGIN